MNDQHARNREAMARRLHFYLESSIVSGSVTHSPEWLAATIRRMCDPEWPTEATRIFFRAVEKGAGERHEASPETWLRVAELLEAGADRSDTQGQASEVADYYATPDGPVNATLDDADYALLREWLKNGDDRA